MTGRLHLRPRQAAALAAAAALLAAAPAGRAASDPALLGCWRTQQVHATLTNNSTVESNSNCVTEFDASFVRSRCRTPSGVVETVMRYEVTAPGVLRWWPAAAAAPVEAASASASSASGATSATPPTPDPVRGTEVGYAISGDFIVTTRRPTPVLETSEPQARTLQVLSLHVDGAPARGGCAPRAGSRLRIGRSAPSSLALNVPPGWRAQLVDPLDAPALAQAIGSDFLVGAFVPKAAGSASVPPSSSPASAPGASTPTGTAMVIVLDVSRFGAGPVREAEFAALRRDFLSRLPEAESTCDTPERACFLVRSAQGVLGYTELVRVAGRAAIVSAVGPQAGSLPAEALVRAAQAFSERLVKDNP